jgi:hypothetical protein
MVSMTVAAVAGKLPGQSPGNFDKQYAEGWSDGFRQCQAMRESEDREDYRSHHWDDRDKAWQQQKDQDAARAYRSQ